MSRPATAIPDHHYKTDIEKTHKKFLRSLYLPKVKGVTYIVIALIQLIEPLTFLFFAPILFMMIIGKENLIFPARVPIELGKLDRSDPRPDGKPHRGRGMFYLGRHRGTFKEYWLAWADILTHVFGLGSTGAGKTETIWSFLANFYNCGSAASLVDGKGSIELVHSGYILTRRYGIEHDLFVTSFQAPNPNKKHKRMSHSINPYSEGTAAQLKEQLASLALSGDAGQNQYFEDTAAMILERVFPALVNMRDKGLINLDIQTIGRALPLGGLYELTVNPDVEPLYQRYIHDHLASIGFDFDNPKKINPEISKQHSQFISHFFKIIASFSIQYRHIFMCDQGDINIKDIMLNRRTHITSLPSLEKSGAELKNLGSIILTGHKMGASASLGDQMEGTAEETLGGLSSSYDVPYALTYDEWAFYAIKDIALLPAQARSIRYCIMFFAQDYAGTERAGEMDAEQVFANTIVKLFGSMQESGKTWQKIRELIGEVKMAVSSKYKYIPGIFGGRYISDPESTEITHRTEVEAKEFQQQREGEFFTFIRGVLSPIKVFYMDLGGWQKRSEKVSGNAFELVRLCKVYRPTTQEKEQILLHERREILLYSHDTLFNKKGFVDELFQNSEAVTSTRAYIDKLNQLANNNALRLGIPSNALTNNNPPKIKTSKPKIETLKQDKPSEATSLPVSNDIEKNTSENDIETDTLSGSGGVISQFSQPNIPENNSLEVTVPQTNEPIETEPNITPVATKKRMSESGNLTQANQDNIDAKIQLKDNFQSLAQETQASREKIQQSISNNQLEEGALLFSSTQKSLLLKDMSTISNLLGYEKEKSDTIAKRIVNKLSSNYYYLAPPRPTQLEKQDIESIESRVKKLLN